MKTKNGSNLIKQEVIDVISKNIKLYENFPKPGIVFKDLNPIYSDAVAFGLLIEYMKYKAEELGPFDYILGIEARGFILGSALAHKLDKGFIPIRKKGKLPGKVHSIEYELEYGKDCLEIQVDNDLKHKKLLILDDVFATGGTLKAVLSLLQHFTEDIAFGVILDIGINDIRSLNKKYFTIFNDD